MHIHSLMFGSEYPPMHLGGLGVACQGLVRGLQHHGVKVTLALPHANAEAEGVDVVSPTETRTSTVRVPSALQPYDTEHTFSQRMCAASAALAGTSNEIYGQDLHQAIEGFTEASVEMTKHVEPDVVHCHDWMTYGAGVNAAKHHSRPLVAHIHATELDRTHFSPNQWIYDRERMGFQAADQIVAVSQYTKSILVDHYGIRSDKIQVVHNGGTDVYDPEVVRLNSQLKQSTKPMVLFLGRLALQKGVSQFLDMASVVHAVRPDVQFVIAGDGHLFGELIDRACELGLQDCIVFAGKVSSDEARKLYARASCFVMPSLSEPFGLVALEAVAQGAPVILSKQSGASEVVRHSFTVDFWNTELMADCVLTILRDSNLATQLTTQAPQILQKLTWERQAGHVHDVYKNLS